jgi:hypothetical protein
MTTNVTYSTSDAMTATILARLICPEKAGWSAEAAQYLLNLRFPAEDLERFHLLLARLYGAQLTADEQSHLNSYMFVNCFLTLIHERARRSLAADPAGQTPNPTS